MNAHSPIPKERSVQRSILAMCGALFPDVLIHHSAVVKLRGTDAERKRQGGILKGDGHKAGWPDLIFVWKGGIAFAEVKREKGGVTSPAQKAMHERLESLGWPVATVTTPEAAYAFLRGCGAPHVGAMM